MHSGSNPLKPEDMTTGHSPMPIKNNGFVFLTSCVKNNGFGFLTAYISPGVAAFALRRYPVSSCVVLFFLHV